MCLHEFQHASTPDGLVLKSHICSMLHTVTELRHRKQVWSMGIIGKSVNRVDENFRQRYSSFHCTHKQNSNDYTYVFDVVQSI
jgi:hypothetical protein